jgi:DNA-binding beta-propeller fold protein YncE
MRHLKVLLTVVLVAGMATAGEPGFSKKPTAIKTDGKLRISFAVSSPTDVAVDLVNARGKVVRHLGGAALGAKNPPPPPFKPGLEQSVEWDLRDDAGKPARGGPFKVRVRLGLKADFDRFIGWKGTPPFNLCGVNGLAVAPDRKLYVITIDTMAPGAGRSENRIFALTPDGKYAGTIYPYPAGIDPRKMRGVDFFDVAKGRVTPRVYDRSCPSYLPGMRAINRQTMACTSDGRLVFANGWAVELYGFGPRGLQVLNTDGTVPRERVNGPTIEEGCWAGYLHVALSPDDKNAYVCGIAGNNRHSTKPRNVLYRVGLGVDDKRQVIFGKANTALSGKEGLNDPRGVGVDSKGRVYVSDFNNNRIAVLDPDGKYLGEIPVKGPSVLAVHPKSGTVYVISMPGGKSYKLLKIAGFKNHKILAELDLSKYGGVTSTKGKHYHPVMTLDRYAAKPILYLGSPGVYARFRLLRVEDRGGSLAESTFGQPFENRKGVGLPYPQGTDADGNFYFRYLSRTVSHGRVLGSRVVDAVSGEIRPARLSATGVVGKNGFFYCGKYLGKEISRKTLAGEKAPFSGTGALSEAFSNWRFYDRRSSFCTRYSGDVWAMTGDTDKSKKPFRAGVTVLGPDGKIKRKDVVTGLQAPTSVRVDSRGNIYVADGLKLQGQSYPPEIDTFAKKLRAGGSTKRGGHSEAAEDAYGEGYGAIFKFGPEGGQIRRLAKTGAAKAGERLLNAYQGYGAKLTYAAAGLKGIYPRISQMSPPRYDYSFSACWCVHAIFDLDAYDRLIVPDAMQFKVRVLDASFNEILSFGGYDQATDKGGKANLPGPEIPFEYPMFAHAGGDYLYITDSASCARRIVRVKLSYTVEESCSVK